jgi:hypothetical protein
LYLTSTWEIHNSISLYSHGSTDTKVCQKERQS